MNLTGGCHCGAVRYRIDGEAQHVALCHCADCRKSAGAPMVCWAAFAEAELMVEQGKVTVHNSSGAAMRSFCPQCGSGLFYRNAEMLPGIVDVQTATLDDPDQLPPQAHIQTVESLGWMKDQEHLPRFDRFPGPDAG